MWPIKKTWDYSIARTTLLDFSFGCDVPEELATLSGGILTLSAGSDDDEKYTLSKTLSPEGVDSLRVSAYGKTQDFPLAQITRIQANFGAGNDSLQIDPEISIPAWIVGGAGADTITGGSGNDAILGGLGTIIADAQGNPIFQGAAGDNSADQLFGGGGNDILQGQEGNDHLDGGAGNDELYGGTGADTLLGGEGEDYLQGNAGDDQLFGGTGDDRLFGDSEFDGTQTGNDTLDGRRATTRWPEARASTFCKVVKETTRCAAMPVPTTWQAARATTFSKAVQART